MSNVVYIIACEISLFITFIISLVAWQRRREIGALPFFILTMSQASWTFGLIIETISSTLEEKVFWDNSQFFGTMMVSLGILVFAYELSAQKVTWTGRIFGLVLSGLVTLLAYVNPYDVIRTSARLEEELGFVSLVYDFTPTMYVIFIFSYVAIIVSFILLIRHTIRVPSEQRPPLIFIMMGIFVPIVGGLMTIADLFPSVLRDVSPFTFGSGNFLMAYGLLRYQLFDVARSAREQVIENMSTATIALDKSNYISLLNQAAIQILDLSPEYLGKKAPTFLIQWLAEAKQLQKKGETSQVFTFEKSGQTLSLDITLTPLHDNRGNKIGDSLIINDITNRVLIQNELARQAQELASRTTELETVSQQSRKRADELKTIADVSRIIAEIKNLDELLPSMTRLISSQFNYYHVGIFLIDENREYAVLRATNSPGGQKMLTRGHKLKIGEKGIVGNVAAQGRTRIALNTDEDAAFFNNPDLPETESEIALPLKIGKDIIGVLDVQSNQPLAFTTVDADVLSILADQVAIAIQNARLFENTQEALAEAETTYRQFLRQEWNTVIHGRRSNVGFQLVDSQIKPLQGSTTPSEARQAISTGKFYTDEKTGTVWLPIQVRGETIGMMDISQKDRPLTVDEMDIAEAISERVALAIENARLLEDTQLSVVKEQTISDIANKIGASVNIDSILQTAVEELGHILPGSEINIQLRTEK